MSNPKPERRHFFQMVGDVLRRWATELTVTRERWIYVERGSRAFTEDEIRAVDAAFRKFDEAFGELDKAFKGWR
jgi:hypothetical protein